MRFLCLHGKGTNSKIFEFQTAALRHELGDHHVYDFVDGSVPCPPAPGIGAISSSNDNFFQYFDESSLASCRQVMEDLEAYIASEGPFDAVMAFSQGAILASGLMIYNQLQLRHPRCGCSHPQPFKCAIFFSGGTPGDPAAFLQHGHLQLIDCAAYQEVIQVPTAHVWGTNDLDHPNYGPPLSQLCSAELRSIFVHGGGHEVPGPKEREVFRGIVRCVQRTIDRAVALQ